MKFRKKYIIIAFLIVSVLNLVIFIYRDHFTYHRYASRTSLYSKQTDKWSAFTGDYPDEELVQASKTLDFVIDKNVSTVDMVTSIAGYLYHLFHDQVGTPSPELSTASPFHQFKLLKASDSLKLWCGNYASMFAFFCWSRDIPCRVVEIMNPGDHHVLNECYIPELGKWIVVDVTSNRFAIMSQDGKNYLNLLEVKDSLDRELQAISYDDAALWSAFQASVYNKYLAKENSILYYYRVNNHKVYRGGEKFMRYLFPVSWYEEWNPEKENNFLFYVKMLMIFSWLGLLGYLSRLYIKRP